MSRGIYVALSGAVAQETALETTATNLANATTAGYQRIRPVFREALANASRPNNLHFAAVANTAVDTSRGAIRSTNRALDVALPEKTYLAVATDRGERYTRAGSLSMKADGKLVTAGGVQLVGEGGKPIVLAPNAGEPTIGADGSIFQGNDVVGKLKVVKFEDASGLSHEAGGLMTSRTAPTTVAKPELETGVVEDSNGSVVHSMTDLVSASRTFEAFQKMLEQMSEADRKVLTSVPTAVE